MLDSLGSSSFYFYTGIEVGSTTLSGYHVQNQKEKSQIKYRSEKVWKIDLPDSEVIIAVSRNDAEDPIASLGRVLGDRSVLYKYLNPNLVAFVAESSRGNSLSKSLTFYLIDTVSGAIHYRAFHPGAGQILGTNSSVQVLLTENLAIYTYWNYGPDYGTRIWDSAFANETIPNNKGMEVVVLEMYESGKPDTRISGARFSSFSSHIPSIISSAFMFPFPITSIGQTRTVSGITSKQILCSSFFTY